MKRSVLFTFILGSVFIFAGSSMAQQVVSSAGNHHENSSGSLSWTVGEIAVETLSNSELILTQGFHQTKLSVTGLDIIEGDVPDISAFPNPAQDHININLKALSGVSGWNYIMYDIKGNVLMNKPVKSDITEIQLGDLPKSTYLLRVYSDKDGARVFKIIKN